MCGDVSGAWGNCDNFGTHAIRGVGPTARVWGALGYAQWLRPPRPVAAKDQTGDQGAKHRARLELTLSCRLENESIKSIDPLDRSDVHVIAGAAQPYRQHFPDQYKCTDG